MLSKSPSPLTKVGEFVIITGELGSGKSTLLNVISGLDNYNEGEMYINGKETSHYNKYDFEEYIKNYIANIFQDFNLINSYTVYQNIELMMLLNGHSKKDVKNNVLEIIDKVGLTNFKNTKVSKLSGGQKQRVAIARAIIKNPNIIIADEPTGNLDSKNSIAIMDILKSISKEKLVILVTHETELAKQYASRIIEIEDGKIIKDYQNNNTENFSKNNENFDIKRLSKNKVRYCSIYRIFPSIINGFKKIKTYSKLKKLLMIGYFATALFVVYSISNIFGILNIQESDYVIHDKNYLQIDVGQLSIDDFLKYEKDDEIEYILPGDSLANFQLLFDDY